MNIPSFHGHRDRLLVQNLSDIILLELNSLIDMLSFGPNSIDYLKRISPNEVSGDVCVEDGHQIKRPRREEREELPCFVEEFSNIG